MFLLKRFVKKLNSLGQELVPYEKQGTLEKYKDAGIPPNSLLNLIKINSSFIELVDSGYQWSGILSAICIPTAIFFIYLPLSTLATDIQPQDAWYEIAITIVIDLLMGSLGLILGLFVFAEYFHYTYYPVRFNRLNRMVYVFRVNGSVMEAPWDEIHFYRTPNQSGMYDAAYLGGCWMEKDGKTVRERFQFGTQCEQDEGALAQWEFIRHYMEHGPQDLIDDVQVCMPIVGKKESYLAGLERISAHFGGWLRIIMFPFSFYVSLWRWLSTRTHKVPVWPKEVEDACVIDPNDPYVKDSRINPEHLQ